MQNCFELSRRFEHISRCFYEVYQCDADEGLYENGSEELLLKAFEEIFLIYIDDGIAFKFTKIEPIREDDAYGGFRVSLIARYDTISAPLKIDITSGAAITPREIDFTYQLMFQENEISVLAYPIETILAEKYETIIRRSILNTHCGLSEVCILDRFSRAEMDFLLTCAPQAKYWS